MYLAKFGTTFCLCTTLVETQLNSPRRDVDSRQGPGGVYRLHGNSDWLDLNVHHIGDQMAASDIDTLVLTLCLVLHSLFVFPQWIFRQGCLLLKVFFFFLQFLPPYPSAFEHLVMIRLPRICSHSSRLDIREASSGFLCCVCRITSSSLPSCWGLACSLCILLILIISLFKTMSVNF